MISSNLVSRIDFNPPLFTFSHHLPLCGYWKSPMTSTSLCFHHPHIHHPLLHLNFTLPQSFIPLSSPRCGPLVLPHPRSVDWASAAGWWPPPGCWWCCSCPWDADDRRPAEPSSGGDAGRGASSAGPGTGRPAAAAAGSGSTAPEKSASGTSPPPGETLTTGQHRNTHTHTHGHTV